MLPLSILLSFVFLSTPAHAASCLPLPSDTAHWWRAEGNAQDSLGLNHGALEGGTVYDAGKVGQGFSFDGIDDLVEIPTQGLPAGASDRTLEVWVKIDALVAQEAYFAGYGLFGATGASYNIGASFGRLYFSSWGPDLFGPQVALGQWHHVAVTNVGSFVTLYLDGVPVNSAPITIDVPPEGTQFFIGKVGGYYGDIRRLQGQVDEVTLYTRALTAEEIVAIYQAGALGKCAPGSPTNHPPVLSFSQETGYVTDGVNPDRGTANLTPLAFKVIYTDQDSDPPQSLLLHIDTGTVNLDLIPLIPDTGDTVPSILKDGNFSNGEQYAYTSTFPKGNYQYHFETSGAETTARLPAAGELTFQTGYSNVAFLPGIKGSRLFHKRPSPDCAVNCEDQLWEPNADSDVRALFLNPDGSSTESGIYTKAHTEGIIDEVLNATVNIYKKFIDSMNTLRNEQTINEWEALPYDWRYNVEDVTNGTIALENSIVRLADEIESLAQTSQTGKVTLITHSMGGQVGKLLIRRLQDEGKADLIDKFIMVATPQLGTPEAMSRLLHGEESNPLKRIVISPVTTRAWGENMPSAYHLLPSPEYFTRAGAIFPVVSFDPAASLLTQFLQRYGTEITTRSEFDDFLLGFEGRLKPFPVDLDNPNILNGGLLTKGTGTQQVLDSWTAPPNVEVIQIAGWGDLDTLTGLHYSQKTSYGLIDTTKITHNPIETYRGDGTVFLPSAFAMDAQKFYVDLYADNRLLSLKRSHGDIFEVDGLRELIKQIIKETLNTQNLPLFISTTEPTYKPKKSILRLFSPVAIDAYDSLGNHTGLIPNPGPDSGITIIEEGIPNSSYREFGEDKYLTLDTQDTYTIKLQGLATGSFTLEIETREGDDSVGTVAYQNIPTSVTMKGELTMQDVSSVSALLLDVDGDGATDHTLDSSVEPDPIVSLQVLKLTIQTLDLDPHVEKGLIAATDGAIKLLKKGRTEEADRVLKAMVDSLRVLYQKGLISSADADGLIRGVEEIREIL
ncbi:MAG: LamG-like jellyroll fold domain-containing protein [Patescibacteria group bacterium]